MDGAYDSMHAMWSRLFWPAVALVMVSVAALLFRHALFVAVRRWSGHRTTEDSLFLRAIRVPSMLWCIVLGLFVAIEMAELPPRLAAPIHAVLEAAIILSVTLTVAGVLGSLVAAAGERRALAVGVTGLFRTSVRLTVLSIGGLVLLSSLGIAVTPILTALGVGGLAVALALQDTLSNLFAGIHLLADKPIRVGDYVRLDSGIAGFVEDIGWRSTRLRLLSNNMTIVPNAILAKSAITNYCLPAPRMSLDVRVDVSYAADPDQVEKVLVEEATQAAAVVPGLLADPPPLVRFIPGFGESALQFTLSCTVATYVDQYLAQHELRKRIIRRFRTEGIEIPF